MKKNIYLAIALTISSFAWSQVGINTQNPQGVFNIDGKSSAATTNPTTGTPTAAQLADDFIVTASGATGIGTSPDNYAALDVKSSNKGILAPRVNLTSSTLDLNADGDNNVANQPKGLLVYNIGGSPTSLNEGYFYWNGTEWFKFDSSVGVLPEITGLNCAGATLDPGSYTATVPYLGNLRIPYTGGNGGSYDSGATITVNGLQFKLRAGKLEFGSGFLVFSVEGTPTVSSPTATTVPIQGSTGNNIVPFLTSALHCSATVGDVVQADIKTIAFAGPLTLTSDNGRAGYHFVGTTPDGKFSVRCFLPTNTAFADVNLQVRYNGGATDPATKDILSNKAYMWGGFGSTQNNQARIPKNQWAGYNGSTAALVTATGQTAANFPTWHDPGVYAGGMPEYRYYNWSEFDPTVKIFYQMEFMMGTTTPNGTANATTCPSGTCSSTKVFFHLRQITAP